MWEYIDTWNGTSYTRHISGSTLQVLLTHTPSQHLFAFSNFTYYVSFFQLPSPILLGRGSHSYWRPSGFANHGPRPLYALQIYHSHGRNAFIATVAKEPGDRGYISGEVVTYGGGEVCVCIDDDVAVPLEIYGPEDIELPTWLPPKQFIHDADGSSILTPLWTLITSLRQYIRIRNWLSQPPYQSNQNLQSRLQALSEDIHDLRYLCASQSRFQGIKLDPQDERLQRARTDVEGYLRGYTGQDVETEAERSTATDQFIEIGLYVGVWHGVRYDLPGQQGWSYNPMRSSNTYP